MQESKATEPGTTQGNLDTPRSSMLRPKRRPDIRTRLVEGETVVLDRREEFIHQFNKTATYIWERCDGLRTSDEITHELCQAFEVDYPTARRDVLATVETLRRSKLLEEC